MNPGAADETSIGYEDFVQTVIEYFSENDNVTAGELRIHKLDKLLISGIQDENIIRERSYGERLSRFKKRIQLYHNHHNSTLSRFHHSVNGLNEIQKAKTFELLHRYVQSKQGDLKGNKKTESRHNKHHNKKENVSENTSTWTHEFKDVKYEPKFESEHDMKTGENSCLYKDLEKCATAIEKDDSKLTLNSEILNVLIMDILDFTPHTLEVDSFIFKDL